MRLFVTDSDGVLIHLLLYVQISKTELASGKVVLIPTCPIAIVGVKDVKAHTNNVIRE